MFVKFNDLDIIFKEFIVFVISMNGKKIIGVYLENYVRIIDDEDFM